MTLEEIAIFSKGKGISKSEISEEGVQCIRYGELYTKYGEMIENISSKTCIDKENLIFSEQEDILIPCSGETAIDLATASCVLKENVAIGGDITIIKTTQYAPFITYYINNKKNEIAKFAQGVSIVHLYPKDFKKLSLTIPSTEEQKKIIDFISLLDKKIILMQKKHKNIREFKKDFIQKLRWNQIKFKNENNENYSDWKELKLKEVLFEHKLKSTGNEEIYSVSVHKGVINQIEHLGRSFASDDLSRYKLAKPGDIIYTKSPTAGFELGIIKQNKNNINVLVSPLYGVFTPKTKELGNYLDCYFESQINTRNYLHPIVQKGAKNTMNISNEVFLSKSLLLPSDFEEQQKISNSIDLINFKEENIVEMLENLQDFKKGLLQKMFV